MISIEARYAELLESLRTKGKEKQFRQVCPLGVKTPIEVLVNCAEHVLSGKVEEAQRITKSLGRSDNSTLFTESAPEDMTEVAAKNKVAIGSYTCMGISEAHARKILNLAPAEIEALGRHAVADYLVAKGCGISEADAVRLAKKGR